MIWALSSFLTATVSAQLSMAIQKSSLCVGRTDYLVVKPAQLTPSHTLSLSSIDNNPYLDRHCETVYAYRTNDVATNPELNPARLIQEALSKVLVHYYPLAGKHKRNANGHLEVHCTGTGVPFAIAVANCTLEDLQYFDGIDVGISKRFIYEEDENDQDGLHLLTFQVTKFCCGGFTIGMSVSHTIVDGIGGAMFFKALAEFASGKTDCTLKPVWERERMTRTDGKDLIQPFSVPGPFAISPLPTTDLVHGWFDVSSDCIKRLKIALMKESGINSFTTLEVLGAYIWRSRFRALELNLDGKTNLQMAVGIRHLVDPPMPKGYYGNAVVTSNVVLMGKDLSEGPLSQVVKLIKDSKRNASETEYINTWLGILESSNELRMHGASMVLTDWRQLGLFEQVDFGWKEVVNMIPIPWSYMDLCYMLPPCSLNPAMKGGVKVAVCLPRVAMEKFKQEMDVLQL